MNDYLAVQKSLIQAVSEHVSVLVDRSQGLAESLSQVNKEIELLKRNLHHLKEGYRAMEVFESLPNEIPKQKAFFGDLFKDLQFDRRAANE